MTTFSVRTTARVLEMTTKESRSRKVKNQRPIAAEEEHRVLQFRPRNSVRLPNWRENMAAKLQRQDTPPAHKTSAHPISAHPTSAHASPEPLDLSRYERPREEPDDF